MNRSPYVIGTLIVVTWFAVGAAAATPPAINNLTGLTSFTPQQQADIAAYAQYWFEQLTSEGEEAVAEVSTARRRLLEPTRLSTTEFRLTYSRTLIPLLETAVTGGRQYVGVNALTILQELGTDGALGAALPFCDKTYEGRMPIRLTATKACGRLMNAQNVSSARVKTALRAMVTAVEHEDQGVVLRRQLEALLRATDPDGRSRFAQALGSVMGRYGNDGNEPAPEILKAVDSVLPDLRHAFLNLRGPEQAELGRDLAGPLVSALGLAQSQWDKSRQQQSESLKEVYSRIILISEQVLKQIDPRVRPGSQTPATGLYDAWGADNRDGYDADVRRWQSVVKPPAYGGR